jgi:hypothetical protein
VFSDAIAPVLHIFPAIPSVRGRSMRQVWTAKAFGVRLEGNPQTGPFYVEGAFPGDTLVVKLNKVRHESRLGDQQRSYCIDGVEFPPNVERTRYQSLTSTSNWVLDREKGIGRLKNPSEHLKNNYTVKLQPMVGCALPRRRGTHRHSETGYPGNVSVRQHGLQPDSRGDDPCICPSRSPVRCCSSVTATPREGDGELTGNALETVARRRVHRRCDQRTGIQWATRGEQRVSDVVRDRQLAE